MPYLHIIKPLTNHNANNLKYSFLLCITIHILISLCYAFRYGYGKEGKKEYDIGSNAELLYEVTLKDFEKVRYFIFRPKIFIPIAFCCSEYSGVQKSKSTNNT